VLPSAARAYFGRSQLARKGRVFHRVPDSAGQPEWGGGNGQRNSQIKVANGKVNNKVVFTKITFLFVKAVFWSENITHPF
jgi:hypothetical protein